MDSALVCFAILFALLMPVLALQWLVVRPPTSAPSTPPLKAPRLSYVPPAPTAGRTAGSSLNRPAPAWPPALRATEPPQARTIPEPQLRARPHPLAVQAQHVVADGHRARIVRLSADADPGQRGLWLKYLVEHDGIFFN